MCGTHFARARMPMTLDGDHGRSSAASIHARRTAVGGSEKIQNLSRPTTIRSARSASLWSKAHIVAALILARSAADRIGPQRLDLGVPGCFETLHKLKEIREVSCPNRAVICYLSQCIATDEFVGLVARATPRIRQPLDHRPLRQCGQYAKICVGHRLGRFPGETADEDRQRAQRRTLARAEPAPGTVQDHT